MVASRDSFNNNHKRVSIVLFMIVIMRDCRRYEHQSPGAGWPCRSSAVTSEAVGRSPCKEGNQTTRTHELKVPGVPPVRSVSQLRRACRGEAE